MLKWIYCNGYGIFSSLSLSSHTCFKTLNKHRTLRLQWAEWKNIHGAINWMDFDHLVKKILIIWVLTFDWCLFESLSVSSWAFNWNVFPKKKRNSLVISFTNGPEDHNDIIKI